MCHNTLLKNLPRILLLLYFWRLTLFLVFICIIHSCPTKILRNTSVWESGFLLDTVLLGYGEGFVSLYTYMQHTLNFLVTLTAHSYSTLLLCFFSTSLTFLLFPPCPFTNKHRHKHTQLIAYSITESFFWKWRCTNKIHIMTLRMPLDIY